MKFILIADLHLTVPGATVWGLDPLDRFDKCLADIERHHADASFCVIAGDLSDIAEPASYRALKSRLARFPLKTFLLIGNHDDREVFRSSFGRAYCDDNGFIQSSHTVDDIQCIFLDTFKGGNTSAGIYCEKRRRWLSRQLETTRAGQIYLFMHHPPFDIGHSLMDLIKLEDPESFHQTIRDHNIRHLFFGHAHRPLSGMWRGIPFAAPPSLNHQVPLVGGSVPTVYSIEPAMYAVVVAAGDRTIVHLDAFLDRKPAAMSIQDERGNWY
jgi:3',5'-cyclic AMP phosphodiesterase CpdA